VLAEILDGDQARELYYADRVYTSPDGTAIHCDVGGAGPPLVLVHGTAADHTRWRPVRAAFEERFTVHAMDRRGRGKSGDEPPYAFEREFEDVAAVCDGIGGTVDLFGHSHGAFCALEAATRAARLRRLVLYEPPIPVAGPLVPDALIAKLEALLAAGDREGVVATFFTEIVRMPPAELAKLRSAPSWPARVAAAHTLPREMRVNNAYRWDPARFLAVRGPVLVLLGGDSPPFFRAAAEAVVAALPHATLALLPGQQHIAIDTAPALLAREVLAFLGT
jgi:pimeloyl-ACP methyl ester carboxylesterase